MKTEKASFFIKNKMNIKFMPKKNSIKFFSSDTDTVYSVKYYSKVASGD